MNDRERTTEGLNALPLGRPVDYPAQYDPAQLAPIPRALGRAELGVGDELPFQGEDVWNGYELSWLNPQGKPLVACAEFRFPADSPNMVESKSFKLYLNSLNQSRFDSIEQVRSCLQRDLSAAAGADVAVSLFLPAQWSSELRPAGLPGHCIDELDVAIEHYLPQPDLLKTGTGSVSETLHSHLLRSRCPVTGQPDWASIVIEYQGQCIDRASLLQYLVSFRDNAEFHEQCIERIYLDLSARCQPASLTVYARYLRRGGLDICPFRSSHAAPVPNRRSWRQ